MRYLPVDMSTFSTMIKGDYIYVDKTEFIYHLFKKGAPRYYFLSRPRRFGKTLLISTLKELFLGNKDLFKGLWIEKSDYQWDQHPVISLDFGGIPHRSLEQLEENLNGELDIIARHYGLVLEQRSPESKFKRLIQQLAERNSVVVLIDEYDKPILDHISDMPEVLRQRNLLKSFYDILKSVDAHLRAIFITGVSKFTQTSLFSGLNNLSDISFGFQAATLVGYTEEEIEKYFEPFIALFAREAHRDIRLIKEEMRAWYNGYLFSGKKGTEKVYNPFSILKYLQNRSKKNYWFQSGTPSFLVELIKRDYEAGEDFKGLDNTTLSEESLGAFDLNRKIPLTTMLFQAGYLTIKSYHEELRAYTLTYPNEEVKISLAIHLVSIAVHKDREEVDKALFPLRSALENNDLEAFCSQLRSLFANIPYNLYVNNEAHFHSLFHFLLDLLGFDSRPEEPTSKGRIDLVLITKHRIFIFEFKFNAPASEALQQIQDRRYYEKYLMKGKHIILVGLAFDYSEKQLTMDWITHNIS
jgi:hypothetical protein